MVERFNRRLAEALRAAPPAGTNRGKNRFVDHDHRNAFLHAYNQTRPQCLGFKATREALANLTEHNMQAGVGGGQPLQRQPPLLAKRASATVWR